MPTRANISPTVMNVQRPTERRRVPRMSDRRPMIGAISAILTPATAMAMPYQLAGLIPPPVSPSMEVPTESVR